MGNSNDDIKNIVITDALQITEISDVAILTANTVWGAIRGLETFTHLLSPSGSGSNVSF